MSKIKDITGERFGRLVALNVIEGKRGNHRESIWLCKCDCGNIVEKSIHNLGRDTFSCGCFHNETVGNNGKLHCKEGTKIPALKAKICSNNTSGVKGVCPCGNKWRAYITFKRKRIELGMFNNFEDAVKARQVAEEEYFHPILEKYDNNQNELINIEKSK